MTPFMSRCGIWFSSKNMHLIMKSSGGEKVESVNNIKKGFNPKLGWKSSLKKKSMDDDDNSMNIVFIFSIFLGCIGA